MFNRESTAEAYEFLDIFPVLALLGPRQVGKTTLAKQLMLAHDGMERSPPAVYFDLERPSDRSKLADAEYVLGALHERLVVIDEIQQAPELFGLLRSLVDEHRRAGRFLILGSASPELIRGSSESLAGRIGFVNIAPLSVGELGIGADEMQKRLWRGGFPDSWLARSDNGSHAWREAFIRTFLERDIPQLGFNTPAVTLRRFWSMVAHWHGQLWNASRLAASLGVSNTSVGRYLDLLEGTYMLRRLEPMEGNAMKRMVKSPKVYLRDTGVLNALLDIRNPLAMQGHPVVGAAWEGLVIEHLIQAAPRTVAANFYRTARGAEADLVLHNATQCVPIECKYSSAPKPSRGFYETLKDLNAARGYIVAPVREAYDLNAQVRVLPMTGLGEIVGLF